MTATTLRRRKDRMYNVVPGGDDYVALFQSGDTTAALYKDGTYIEDIATTGDVTVELGNILSYQLVASRYFIFASTSRVEVWDLDTNTVAGYDVDAGWLIAGAGAVGGAVYWIELDDSFDWDTGGLGWQKAFRLRTAGYDLVDPTTVATVTVEDNFHWEGNETDWFGLTETAAHAGIVAYDAVAHEVTDTFHVRIPLTGIGAEFSQGFDIGFGYAYPESTGGALGYDPNVLQMFRYTDDVEGAPVAHWPASGDWALVSFYNGSLSAAGDAVAAFGGDGAGKVLLRTSSAEQTGEAPASRFSVSDHPTLVDPILFFIRE